MTGDNRQAQDRRRRVAALLALAPFAFLTSCGSSNDSARVDTTVPVSLENFKISAPSRIHAGLVRFDLHSLGPTMHEFVVSRTDAKSDALPLADDGTVDDHGVHAGFTLLGEKEGIDMNQSTTFTLRLSPGHYVLFCNMEGHYLAGMHAEVTVP